MIIHAIFSSEPRKDYWNDYDGPSDIISLILGGLCGLETERSLIQDKCIQQVWALPSEDRETIRKMIFSMCGLHVFHNFYPGLRPACTWDCIFTLTPSGALVYEDLNCLSNCPSTITTTNRITSPGYSSNYPLYTTVYYTMTAPANESISIEIEDLEVEVPLSMVFREDSLRSNKCVFDWVMILGTDGEELLSKKCDMRDVPGRITFTNKATLVFHSDRSVAKRGFSATLSTEVTIVITQLNTNPDSSLTRSPITKLNPIQEINYWETATKPVFENSRGRYPWICSFRGRQDKSHYCGATILSRPPGPLVIVTAAHCVFLCKDESGDPVPNCCCENVKGNLCLDSAQCGVKPGVEVMTGQDAEVICGEFETGGNFTAEESGEEYNIVLKIKSISVHPDYNITRGVNNSQYVVNDMATLHLEENLSEREISQLTPVCLPQPHNDKFSLHAGWSAPPPQEYIEDYRPLFKPFLRDFRKLHHYNLSLIRCQDPQQYFDKNGATGINIVDQTDSFYPPGTICAREKNLEFCPSSGESGSPLMVQDQQGRFSSLGVNSFLKGCSSFSFTSTNLQQFSENPIVYTRLSCFLSWIADQYNMSYKATVEEPECQQGIGDINEITTDICRTTPTDDFDRFSKNEAECIFPFYLDGEEQTQCTLSQLKGFTRPQFICPIRTLKGRGTNYTTDDSDATYCPTNSDVYNPDENPDPYLVFTSIPVYGPNNQLELDPDNDKCSTVVRKSVFASCKNTCPGGEKERNFNLMNLFR